MTNHEPWEYQAHVTDDWERDSMVVQVRQMHRGHTSAIGQVLEDRDGMPVMDFRRLTDAQHEGREHLIPTPGIRLRHDVAVAMARAILTEAGKDADEVERLKGQVENQRETIQNLSAALDEARAAVAYNAVQVEGMERLVETLTHSADREARSADHFHEMLEHQRREDRHEQDRRHHPSRVVDFDGAQRLAEAVTGAKSFQDSLAKVGEVFRGTKVTRSDLGL